MKKKKNKKIIFTTAAVAFIAFAAIAFMLFAPLSAKSEKAHLYIDNDDNIDSVKTKLAQISTSRAMTVFNVLAGSTNYAENIKAGRYAIDKSTSTLGVFRMLKKGNQEALNVVIPSVRTTDRLAEDVTRKLMISSDSLLYALSDSAICASYGFDTLTIQCMFIPNTYEIYWTTTVTQLLDRMKDEYEKFWTAERRSKAEALGLTPIEVTTVASIVDEETANNAEKPLIARLYLNRLNQGMKLQADPTVKYAMKNFEIKRILTAYLSYDSPFNTYKNEGLPPGPIRIPSISGIDAVLNCPKHDYVYMCAKEDFSGTHNFAVTYEEHQKNAKKYSEALDKRNIMK